VSMDGSRAGRQAAQLGARSSCPFPGAGAFLSAMRVTGTWTNTRGGVMTDCKPKGAKKIIILGTTQSRRPGTHPHQPLACTVLYCSTKGLDASGRGVIQQVALEAGTKTTSAQLHKRFE
jgi:hypothetical protein